MTLTHSTPKIQMYLSIYPEIYPQEIDRGPWRLDSDYVILKFSSLRRLR